MGRLGHRAAGPRAPGDPRAPRRLPRPRPRAGRRVLAGGVDAGYRDDGAPGPRTQYGPTYYGGFLLDPDGNSVEAVHGDREDAVPDGRVDHLWLRVRDPQASRRFYTTIAPHAGLRLAHDEPGRVQLSGPDYSFSLVRDERPLTEHVHLAFPAREDAAVRAFHAAALAAGYEDHGAPGERAVYHPGYYGAFVLDPDGHNVEVVNHTGAELEAPAYAPGVGAPSRSRITTGISRLAMRRYCSNPEYCSRMRGHSRLSSSADACLARTTRCSPRKSTSAWGLA